MHDTPLTEQQLMDFEQLLKQRRHDLQQQIAQIESATEPVTLDQQSVGRVSRIDAIQQQQMAVANKTQLLQQLQRVETALNRVSDGSYGYCLACGELIANGRLEVQPEVTLCLACQAAREV